MAGEDKQPTVERPEVPAGSSAPWGPVVGKPATPRRRSPGRPSPKQVAFRVCASLVLGLATLFAVRALRIGYVVEREIFLLQASGYTALGALFLSLSVTPVHRLVSRVRRCRLSKAPWLAYRRAFGITAALAGLAHGAFAFGAHLDFNRAALLSVPYLRAGLVTLAILSALLLTSFPSLITLLRIRLWQHLHRLAYVAAFFLLQHLMLSPFAPRGQTILLFSVLGAVALLRLVPAVGRRGAGRRSS